jgi:hypothetical protein
VRSGLFAGSAFMKNLITAFLLVALSCFPAVARADVTRLSERTAGELPGNTLVQPGQLDVSPGTPLDYAQREAAAPQLANYAGGSNGVYIGSGVLVVALLVVLVILLVR